LLNETPGRRTPGAGILRLAVALLALRSGSGRLLIVDF